MKRSLAAMAALVCMAFMAACSTVPPQSVTLYPQAKAPTGNVGKGKAVAFKVVDARADKVVGYRNTDGSRTAPITVAGDLAQAVGEPATRVLSELGFKPAAYKEGAPLSLVITIRELAYSAQGATVTRKIAAKCVLSAKVVNGPGHWEGSFPVSQERELVMNPDENANARFINDVLSESLSLMMSDPEMVQYLAKDFMRDKSLKE
ncbi:MAG: YajG family lipoprotein [Thermodesulfobacteriota bacterium]